MPFARLTLLPGVLDADASTLAHRLTELISGDLDKRHDLTSVLIEAPPQATWSIGAAPVEVAAHLEVCVTAGTNSEMQKQTFIANAMATLRAAFPTLSTATYILIKELPANAWGYDGRTQADRALIANPSGSRT